VGTHDDNVERAWRLLDAAVVYTACRSGLRPRALEGRPGLHAACVAWSIDRPNPTAQVLVITDGKVAPPRGLVVSEPNEQQSLWGEPLAALLMRNGFQGPVHMLVIALEDEYDVALPNLRTLCGLTLGVLFLAGSLLYGADVGQVASCQLTCVPACARARVVLCKPTRCGKAAARGFRRVHSLAQGISRLASYCRWMRSKRPWKRCSRWMNSSGRQRTLP
jgi:hypothetical protein